MSSVVDQLPHQPGDPEGSRGRDSSESDRASTPTGFSDEFATEVRSIFTVTSGKGLFGTAAAETPEAFVETVHTPETVDTPEAEAVVETEDALEAEAVVEEAAEPQLFAAPVVTPRPEKDDAKPSVGLFLPREEEAPDRAAPTLTGLAVAKADEPTAVPNLFVSSSVAPAEVAFVPAEEVERRRYLWLLILIGLLLVAGAIWLTIMAQSTNTVDAPVTTVETVPTTLVSTTEAPATTASTVVSTTATTEAPATSASTETTLATTVTTAAPAPVQTTAPRRPATTTRRPATTAAPATSPPTTAAPTTAATVPDVTFAPPTWSPPTTAAAEPPAAPAEPAEQPAAEG